MKSTSPSDHAAVTGELVMQLAQQVAGVGEEIGLPFIAASADIGNPEPMRSPSGAPLVETIFRWLDADFAYWNDRAFALKSGFVRGARTCSEPFYFWKGEIFSWRRIAALEGLSEKTDAEAFGIGGAIICPCHLPHGVIGAVVWATPDQDLDISDIFQNHAARLHILTLKFVAAYQDFQGAGPAGLAVSLTRREIQCLKWAAAGKTDSEIAIIVGISQPTVRFHITNSTKKLDVTGRSQAVHRATTLGYIGAVLS